jgi:hypothetical protein
MTPKEIIKKADKIKHLQSQLSIIRNDKAFIVLGKDKTNYIRTANSNSIPLTDQLNEFASFIAETIITKSILDLEQQIKELCDG